MVAFTVTRGGEYLIVAELPSGTSRVERTVLRTRALSQLLQHVVSEHVSHEFILQAAFKQGTSMLQHFEFH